MSADDARRVDPPLALVKGGATAEEVAALVAVLRGLAAAAAAVETTSRPGPRSAWSAPERRLRTTLLHGPGAWRASGLPR